MSDKRDRQIGITIFAIVVLSVVCLFYLAMLVDHRKLAESYRFGAESQRAGASAEANPYDFSSPRSEQWLRGWVNSAKEGK